MCIDMHEYDDRICLLNKFGIDFVNNGIDNKKKKKKRKKGSPDKIYSCW